MTEACTYGLTRAMRDALLAIQELTAAVGHAPSFEELRRELDLSSRTRVYLLVAALGARGYVRSMPRRARSLVVLRPIAPPEEPEFVGTFDPTPAQAAELFDAGLRHDHARLQDALARLL